MPTIIFALWLAGLAFKKQSEKRSSNNYFETLLKDLIDTSSHHVCVIQLLQELFLDDKNKISISKIYSVVIYSIMLKAFFPRSVSEKNIFWYFE